MSQADYSSSDTLRAALAAIFDKAQADKRMHSKLVSALLKVRASCLNAGGRFFEHFVEPIHRLLLIKNREPSVERCVEFIVLFSNSCARSQSIVNEGKGIMQDNDQEHKCASPEDEEFLTSQLCMHLLKFHNAKDSAVRFRVCQLVASIFNNLDEDAEIDDDLWDSVVDAMVMRCKDKTVAVRLEAARGLRRLHEPDDLTTTATSELIALIHTDKSKDVRRVALMSLGIDKKTLPHFLQCTRDVQPTVRRAALRVVAESIELKALSIAQRISLMQQGLRDRDKMVAKEAKSLLATRWLPQCNFDILELLSKFAVIDEEETALLVVNALLDSANTPGADPRLVEEMQTMHKMDSVQYWQVKEAALLWRAQCEYASEHGDEAALEERLGMGSIMDFSSVLKETLPTADAPTTDETEFQCRQMLIQARLLDFGHDEAGRIELTRMLEEHIQDRAMPEALVSLATETLMCTHCGAEEDYVWRIAEMISDVVDSGKDEEESAKMNEGEDSETGESEDQRRLREIETLCEQIEAKRAEKARHVKEENYAQAAALKQEILDMEEQVAELECEFEVLGGRDWGLQRGLSIAEPMLRRTRQTLASSPTLAGLYSTLLIPACQSEFPAVRTEVARCLGLFALIDPTGAMAKIVVPLLIKMASFDIFEVQVAAVQAVCDLVMIFPGIQEMSNNEDSEQQQSMDPVSIILSFLDGTATDRKVAMGVEEDDEDDEDSAELRQELSVKMTTVAAEGLARLLFNGRTRRSDVVSELLLLFFSNTVHSNGANHGSTAKDDPLFRVRQCLHVFFPEFARANIENQRLIESATMDAFLRLVGPASTEDLPPVEAFIKFVAFYLQERAPQTAAPTQADADAELLKGTCFDDGVSDEGASQVQQPSLSGDSLPASFHGRLALGLLGHMMLQEPNSPLCGVICKAISKLDIPASDTCGIIALSHLISVCIDGTAEFGQWDSIAKKSTTRPLKSMHKKLSKFGVNVNEIAGADAMIRGTMRRLRVTRGDLFDSQEEPADSENVSPDMPGPSKKRLSSGSTSSHGDRKATKKAKTRRGLRGKTKSNNMLTSSMIDNDNDESDRRSSSGSSRSSIGSPLRTRHNNKKASAPPSAVRKAAEIAKMKQTSPEFAPAAPAKSPVAMSLSDMAETQDENQPQSKAETLLNDIDALLSSDDEAEEEL